MLSIPISLIVSLGTIHDRSGEDFWFFFYEIALPLFWFLVLLSAFTALWLFLWAKVTTQNLETNVKRTAGLFQVFGYIFGVLTIVGSLIFVFSDHYYFNSFEFGIWSGLQDFVPALTMFLFLPLSLAIGFFLSANILNQIATRNG